MEEPQAELQILVKLGLRLFTQLSLNFTAHSRLEPQRAKLYHIYCVLSTQYGVPTQYLRPTFANHQL
jgi:hypothetical protein